jgi:hypothetical protein
MQATHRAHQAIETVDIKGSADIFIVTDAGDQSILAPLDPWVAYDTFDDEILQQHMQAYLIGICEGISDCIRFHRTYEIQQVGYNLSVSMPTVMQYGLKQASISL